MSNYYEPRTIRMNGKCRRCGAKRSVLVDVTWTARGDVVLPYLLRSTCLNADESAWAPCSCGKSVLLRKVQGKYVADKGCDGRCMSATGFQCECSCGGKNHGAQHAA